jgi:hypothetical protein
MTDVSRSDAVTSDGNSFQTLRPGVRLTEGQKAVIAEYAYIKEQLAGPQFGSPAPPITCVERGEDK